MLPYSFDPVYLLLYDNDKMLILYFKLKNYSLQITRTSKPPSHIGSSKSLDRKALYHLIIECLLLYPFIQFSPQKEIFSIF